MKIQNIFTVGKSYSAVFSKHIYIDDTTGEISVDTQTEVANPGSDYIGTDFIVDYIHIFKSAQSFSGYIFFYNENKSFLGKADIQDGSLINAPKHCRFIAFKLLDYELSSIVITFSDFCAIETKVNPHYKSLAKKYTRESNQMLFREKIDGTPELWGTDYLLVKNASINDVLTFSIYQNGALYVSCKFNKTDCDIDHFNRQVKLKFLEEDNYSKVLDNYDNKYDLLKLGPAIRKIDYYKRCLIQIYIQGESVISNYFGGTYWDDEVDEEIDSESQLINRYYFSKGPKLIEISLTDFNYGINAAFSAIKGSNIWNATDSQGNKCSIVFEKIASEGDILTNELIRVGVKMMSTGNDGEYYRELSANYRILLYDIYSINIYTGADGSGTKVYTSQNYFANDSDFIITVGEELYKMVAVQDLSIEPSPSSFYLGEETVEYQIWGRLLCDVSVSSDGQVELYDLPYDDFATPRANFKKCIGLTGFDQENSVVKIVQTSRASNSPTAYGFTDYDQYFLPPYSIAGNHYLPLARNTWANTSLWVYFDYTFADSDNITGFEEYCRKFYKRVILKDAYHISDVIKALLKKIDPTLTHEMSAEYSKYLYDRSFNSLLGDCQIFITQKTNILKGEYDQAAKKVEISLKQVMDMLRDCFRCYCFIDSQNRFRIEHVSYFLNGMSYDSISDVQIDLTDKLDRFNKKPMLFAQQSVKYSKSELNSRYEFEWSEDVTDAMGQDLTIDINSDYIDKSKTESINVSGFISDIDYMLFAPDKFSNDGFALLLAKFQRVSRYPYSQWLVPIVYQSIYDEKQGRNKIMFTQNYYASFNWLVKNYMYDMPAYDITCGYLPSLQVLGILKSMEHEIEVQLENDPDLYKLITTELGDGVISEMTSNIDTKMLKITLNYLPQ